MKLNFNTLKTQKGKLNKPFRQVLIQKGTKEKWISGVLKFDWYYVFKYIDDNTMFSLHVDFNDKVIEKLNHEQTQEKICNLDHIK